jgi:predicted PhzF superfamily epimerase YddE/YHI9
MPVIPIYHVDAFTDRPFAGNPAAVCLLAEERPAAWMQALAAEMNLSETAIVRRLADGFELRWFTPAVEVDLCGHATLAAAHTLWEAGDVRRDQTIRFHTKSGVLTAVRDGALIQLNFPATPVEPCPPPDGMLEATGARPAFVGRSKFDAFLVVESAEAVRALRPDFRRLAEVATRGIIVTAQSDDPRFDFLSRFFCPAVGIDEDPVTGSAHCALTPFWAERLGKTRMTAYQASKRGGTVHVELHGDRVLLGGHAVTVLRGQLA